MRLPRLIFPVFILLAAGLPALAASSSADAPHVHVQLVVPDGQISGGTAEVGLYFKLEPGWHVYWKNAGDAGEPPHIKWTLPEGITAGPLQFPAPSRLPLGPLMDYGYEDEVLYPLTLNVAKTARRGPAVLHAKVDWLVCRATCIPGKAELEVSRKIVAVKAIVTAEAMPDAEVFKRLIGRLPKPLPPGVKAVFQATKEGFRLSVETGQRETEAAFFPADQEIVDNPAPQKLTPTAKGLVLDLKKDANLAANPGELKGVLELSGGRAFEIAALPGLAAASADQGGAGGELSERQTSGAKAPDDLTGADAGVKTRAYQAQPTAPTSSSIGRRTSSLSWLALLRASGLAFLGGLLLNLMPCVFPVLFLKGLALVQSGHRELHKLRVHGLVYTAGILASFWVLVAVLLGLRAAGATLGWGFQFQSPVFLALMAGLLFFVGLSLAGQFEIGLTLTSAGGSLASKRGYRGSFFTGVLAVVVATPCTAPFMGAAIGYALAQPAAVTFAVFTALALGLAAPYFVLTLNPVWTRLLPKPGVWMEVLRQAHFCNGDLAGVGAGGGLRSWDSGGAAGELSSAGDCGVVSGQVAGHEVGYGGCVADCCRGHCHQHHCAWETGDSAFGFGCGRRCRAGLPSIHAEELAALVCRGRTSCPGCGAAGACGLHGQVVPELPGKRACSPGATGGGAGPRRCARSPFQS